MLTFTLNKRHIYLLLILLLATSCRCGNNHHTVSSPQTPTEMLRSGDLVFRLGRSLESRVIASDGKYSHIGIIIRKDSSTLVAHIEPSPNGSERTKYESLEDFFHICHPAYVISLNYWLFKVVTDETSIRRSSIHLD